MKKATLYGKEYYVGLDWDRLDSSKSLRSAVATILKSSQHKERKYGVVVRGADEAVVGLAPKKVKVSKKIPSAAALLSKASQENILSSNIDLDLDTSEDTNWDWLVIERLDEDLYWMVVIFKGTPVPTSDIVGDRVTVLEHAAMFQQASDLVAHVPEKGLREELQLHGKVSSSGFDDLISDISVKPSSVRLKQLTGLTMTYFVILVVAVVLISAYFMYSNWKAKQEAAAAARLAAQRAAMMQKRALTARTQYGKDVQAAVYSALDKGLSSVQSYAQTPSPESVVDAWLSIIYSVRANHLGWNLVGAKCSIGATPKCEITLKKGEFGTYRSLFEAREDAVLSGNEASFVIRSADQLVDREYKYSTTDLYKKKEMLVGPTSTFQILTNGGISYEQGASSEIAEKVVMPVPPAAVLKRKAKKAVGKQKKKTYYVKMGVGKGSLSFSGSGLWQVVDLSSFISTPGFYVDALTVSIGETGVSGWSLDAGYLVRTDQAPDLPSILIDGTLLSVPLPDKFVAGSIGALQKSPSNEKEISMKSSGSGSLLSSDLSNTVPESENSGGPLLEKQGEAGADSKNSPEELSQDVSSKTNKGSANAIN